VPRIQVTTPGNGAVIGHLKDPEPRRASGSVEHPALAMDQEKDVLEQVVGLGCIPQNPISHSADDASVAAKKICQCFPAPAADLGNKGFIGNFAFGAVCSC
jgi:hypothetical protein